MEQNVSGGEDAGRKDGEDAVGWKVSEDAGGKDGEEVVGWNISEEVVGWNISEDVGWLEHEWDRM